MKREPAMSSIKVRTFLHVAAALALTASGAVHATTYCVSTGAQLASALSEADSNNQDDVIKVMLGVKTNSAAASGAPRWRYAATASDADNSLELSGNWTSGCVARAAQVPLTVLDAELDGPALEIVLAADSIAEIRISDLRVVRGYGGTTNAASGLRVDASGGGTPLIEVERMNFQNSGASGELTSVVRLQLSGGNLRFRNSQINGNSTRNGAALMASVGLGAEMTLANNTVVGNHDTTPSAATPMGGVSVFGSGTMNVYNNLFWNNTAANATDLKVANNFGLLVNNHIGILSGTPDANTGRTQGDPLITIGGNGCAVPSINSPVRDSGSTYVPGGRGNLDLLGTNRVQGIKVDRGAVVVDALFGNGFD